MMQLDIEVIFTFNDMRKSPAFDGYRPEHLMMENYLTTGVHHYYDIKEVAPNEAAKTGRNGGMSIGSKITVLSPNHKNFYESGGTLLKIGSKAKNIRLDVGAKTLLHLNFQFTKNLHVPIGIIGSGIYGGLRK